MKKSRSNHSKESQKSRFEKPGPKQRQPASSKTVARNTRTRTTTTSKKSSSKPLSPSALKPANPSKPSKGKVRITDDTAKAKTADRRQEQLEKGRMVKQLLGEGYSREEVAEKLRLKESVIRELKILGDLPKDLEEMYLSGKADRKEVLKKARARKDHGNTTVPLKQEAPAKVPEQNSQPERATVAPTEEARQNPPSFMTEEKREERISEYAKLIVDWLPQTGVHPSGYKTFFKQVDSILDGTRPWLFSEEAPEPHEINPGEDPWKVIRRCKPRGANLKTAPDVTNNAVTWLARWIQRVIPDRDIMKEAISKARTQLLAQGL